MKDPFLVFTGIGVLMFLFGYAAGVTNEKIARRMQDNENDINKNDAEQN